MTDEQERPSDQAAQWNGAGSRGWTAVQDQDLLDDVLKPLEDVLVDAVSGEASGHVLDVGCGTGSTTVAVARRLAETGRCTGIDIAEPMIAAARARAERAGVWTHFIVADAQTYAFAAEDFDMVVSRFGVMFFSDPTRAFANLRRAAKAGARLRCVVWRSMDDNPFMTEAERAAAPLLPDLPIRRPNEPGQFGFADRDRVRGILQESGWSEIDIHPIDVTCAMPQNELERYLTHLGPVGRILPEADEDLRARVISRVRPAFDPYVHGAEVRFDTACWMVGARA